MSKHANWRERIPGSRARDLDDAPDEEEKNGESAANGERDDKRRNEGP